MLAVLAAIADGEKDEEEETTAYPTSASHTTTDVPMSEDPSADKRDWKGVSLESPAAKAGAVFAAAFLVSRPPPLRYSAPRPQTLLSCSPRQLNATRLHFFLHFDAPHSLLAIRSPLASHRQVAGMFLAIMAVRRSIKERAQNKFRVRAPSSSSLACPAAHIVRCFAASSHAAQRRMRGMAVWPCTRNETSDVDGCEARAVNGNLCCYTAAVRSCLHCLLALCSGTMRSPHAKFPSKQKDCSL